MSNYYLFSDFDMDKGFTTEVANNLLIDIKDSNKIVFIASSPNYSSITDKYAKKYLEWFSKIGINFKHDKVIDNRMEKSEMKDHIKDASAVFLMGGTTPLQINLLKENELDKSLRKYKGCVLGLSAGAINMAKISICSESSGHDKTEIYEGLNLVDISIEPHFNSENSDTTLKELLPISETYEIYAMCDESAIVFRGSEQFFYGEIYLISHGSIRKLNTNSYN